MADNTTSVMRFGRDYESYFEPGIYLKTYYTGLKLETDDYYRTNMDNWHNVFVNSKYNIYLQIKMNKRRKARPKTFLDVDHF